MNWRKILKFLFAVYNDKYLKIICFCGLKIKIFNFKKYLSYRNYILKKYIKKNKIDKKKYSTLLERIENL